VKVAEMPLGPHSEARAELTERAESTLREQLVRESGRGRIGWRLSYSRNALRGAGCGRLGPIGGLLMTGRAVDELDRSIREWAL
jgi:hypothetical protein